MAERFDKPEKTVYNNTKEAKLVWAKKILQELVEKNFCGNVQINFHQGMITGRQITDFEKAPS